MQKGRCFVERYWIEVEQGMKLLSFFFLFFFLSIFPPFFILSLSFFSYLFSLSLPSFLFATGGLQGPGERAQRGRGDGRDRDVAEAVGRGGGKGRTGSGHAARGHGHAGKTGTTRAGKLCGERHVLGKQGGKQRGLENRSQGKRQDVAYWTSYGGTPSKYMVGVRAKGPGHTHTRLLLRASPAARPAPQPEPRHHQASLGSGPGPCIEYSDVCV